MRSLLVCWVSGFACLLLLPPATRQAQGAAPPLPASSTSGSSNTDHSRVDDVLSLARKIDRFVQAGLKDKNAVAAPLADDSEFIRRVYLDLAGRIPRVSEVREFLDDRRSDKRVKLVEKLLASSNYVSHFTNVWRSLLLPNNNNQQVQFLGNQIETWVRSRVRDNTPYDKLVRELITAPIDARTGFGRGGRGYDAGAVAFFQAQEMKPDNIAAATSRLFLGVKIECAQCHDHPFAQWTRRQFWEYTAFFAGIKQLNPQAGVFGGASDDPKAREIEMPGSAKKIPAKFLDGKAPEFKDDSTSRVVLADWMTTGSNPFFAKAAANRLWEHFLGIGLVDPVDDARDENPPSHPELLDTLAKGLVDNKFDLKFLMRAITASQAYQRSSQQNHASQDEIRLFAKMPLRGLTGEQIFDSLATAVGYRGDVTAGRFVGGFAGNNTPRGEIVTKFTNPVDRKTEAQTSILQALSLMNGKFVADATSIERSETLAAVIDAPFLSTREKLDTLFLATVSRPMRGSEVGRLVPYVEGGGPSRNSKKALADVFWVLLNSSEFILQH